ncbi:MAG: hypothetical protein KGL43_02055 [Burkholderiales bacterium]|nr:hypothetical protein [Burkholderiales bacterium]MDE2452353.1 hypothetical protein [Burkholderiales bacterium]
MLTIRQAQLDTLADWRARDFEDRALAHLQRWMPRHCNLLGAEPMRRVVRQGLAKARHYGLGAECTVIGYVDLMCLLGSGFDLDPLLPWAAEILNEPPRADPVERGDRLYDAAWSYIDRIVADYRDAGGKPLTERLVVLLREARSSARDELVDDAMPAFAVELQQTLAQYFPAKTALVGAGRIAALALDARRRALQHGFRSLRGTRVVALLMFILGAGFDADPLLPWLPPLLAAADDEQARIDQLLARGAETLRRWWDFERAGAH